MVTKIADKNRRGKRVRIGASDPALTRYAGMVAVTELVARLKVIESIDTAVGPVKKRNREFGLGQVPVAMAAAQLAGQGFLVGRGRVRTDTAGQELVPVAGVATSTGCEIVKRVQQDQWLALESGIGAVHQRMLELVPGARRDALCAGATIDIDATDVQVYGRDKRGVAYNYQGQRCGRPNVASWAQAEVVLAADLLTGDQDPRSSVVGLLSRAVAALPVPVRAGEVRVRLDAGYFAGDLARAARTEQVCTSSGHRTGCYSRRRSRPCSGTARVPSRTRPTPVGTHPVSGRAWWHPETAQQYRREQRPAGTISAREVADLLEVPIRAAYRLKHLPATSRVLGRPWWSLKHVLAYQRAMPPADAVTVTVNELARTLQVTPARVRALARTEWPADGRDLAGRLWWNREPIDELLGPRRRRLLE